MKSPIETWTEDSLRAAQAKISAPAWLAAWRREQLQEFLKRGFPKQNDENWKYTSVASLWEQKFSNVQSETLPPVMDLSTYFIEGTDRLVFINGIFSATYSLLGDLPEKVVLTHCMDVITPDAALYQTAVSQHALSVFHWLNGAFSEDGLFLHVPENIKLRKPIHLLYLTTTSGKMHHPRHIIQLGENSQLSLLEEYGGLGDNHSFNNVMTQIAVGQNATLHYYKLQQEAASTFHIANTHIEQSKDSVVRAHHIALGAKINREDLNVSLKEAGAECELSGFYYPKSQQHIDFHTRIDHDHSQTGSRQYYKGMIAQHGRAVFNGKIIVHPKAQNIKAKQENHNLLLSKSAEIDTKPELEVFADNVDCTHGATVGHLDPNALFYLRSRGIPEGLARQLLMFGFFNDILERFPDKRIAEYVKKKGDDWHEQV